MTQPSHDYSADYEPSLYVPFEAFNRLYALTLKTNNEGAEQTAPSLSVSSVKYLL